MGDVRDVAESFYKAFSAGDLETAMGYFADGCITVTPGGPLDNAGHEEMGRSFRAAFPDARMEVTRVVEAGDEAFVCGRFVGTHTGDLVSPNGTIPASGNPLDLPFADYFRAEGGRIVGHEVYWDQLTMLGHLGALPPM